MGNQGHAGEGVRLSREWIQAGLIGPVHEAHIWTTLVWPQGMKERPTADPVSAQMDWDRWLGRAPYRDFNHAYHPAVWRGWRDFGSGAWVTWAAIPWTPPAGV